MNTEKKIREARRRGARHIARLRKAAKSEPILLRVLQIAATMGTDSISTVLSFLLGKNQEFVGKTALALLQAGDVGKVMAEARTYLKHGA